MSDILDALNTMRSQAPVPDLPSRPLVNFNYRPASLASLRRLRTHMAEAKPPQKRRTARMLLSGGEELQLRCRIIAQEEGRTIASMCRILLGLGINTYDKLKESITAEAAVDAVVEEIAHGS